MIRLSLIVAAALPLAACGDATQSDANMADVDMVDVPVVGNLPDPSRADANITDATPTDATAFVTMAGASDLYEIESSELALDRAETVEVRDFAQMMVDEHRKTTEQVTAAAKAAGLSPPPPALTPMQEQMVSELEGLNGPDFERRYLEQQVEAHEKALALHRNYAENGDTPELQEAATAAAPIVEKHLDRVRELAGGGA